MAGRGRSGDRIEPSFSGRPARDDDEFSLMPTIALPEADPSAAAARNPRRNVQPPGGGASRGSVKAAGFSDSCAA